MAGRPPTTLSRRFSSSSLKGWPAKKFTDRICERSRLYQQRNAHKIRTHIRLNGRLTARLLGTRHSHQREDRKHTPHHATLCLWYIESLRELTSRACEILKRVLYWRWSSDSPKCRKQNLLICQNSVSAI